MANPREMAERLRREHERCNRCPCPEECGCASCDCGAEDHNTQVDALLVAIDEEMRHADRLAEAAEAWIADMDLDAKGNPASVAAHLAAEMRRRFGDALSAHRARRGGQ